MQRAIKIALILCIICSKSYAFQMIYDTALPVVAGKNEAAVVYTALEMFSTDMELVSGKKTVNADNPVNNSVLVGTIGYNKIIDKLIDSKKINVDKIKGQWEAFQIQVVQHDNKKLLVVVGSDKRGTAYGVLELSHLIGVSPWVWWADSKPQKTAKFNIADNYFNTQKPSVQYRGIFINDEDLGFNPWSTQTIDKAQVKGATGPKAYAKVFELMLRLRANTLWPAMHSCTVPFYMVKGNKEMADKYGIVVGTSHHEPLMRNTEEWDTKKKGPFNYATNSDSMLAFWGERLKEVQNSENFYTLGIRGVGDVGMEGANTLDEKTKLLDKAITDQRDLLKKYVNKNIEKLPQVFVPYKEVLPIYENGLKVPDDVTLMWCDDNYGYMTQLSSPEEQKRSGGSGVYYHLSYLGRPHQYMWLSSTPPAMVYWQMKQAWDNGAHKIWIVNVGDIKPAEYDLEFYMNMAWNVTSVNESNIYQLQKSWLEREFGKESAERLNVVRNEYYRLANIRRPEFMGWSRQEEPGYKSGKTPVIDTEFNPFIFGDEIYSRLKAYEAIVAEAQEIEKTLPISKKDAYYQLILFPVRASAEMNKKLLYAQKARMYAKLRLPVANEYSGKSNTAFNAIDSMVNYYNKDIANGKWNKMMMRRIWGTPVYDKAPLPDTVKVTTNSDVLVWAENSLQPARPDETIKLTPFVNPAGTETFVSLFSYNNKVPQWKVSKHPDWLTIKEEPLNLKGEKRIVFALNTPKLKTEGKKDQCIIIINEKAYTFDVEVQSINKSISVEYNGMVIVDVNKYNQTGERPTIIEGLGYTTKAIHLKREASNVLRYKIFTTSAGNVNIRVSMLPNHPVKSKTIRYAISVNGGEPKVVSIASDFKERDETWKKNILRNQSITISEHQISKPGEQVVEIFALDEGIILDQMVVDFQAGRKYYELPRANIVSDKINKMSKRNN